VSDLGTVSGTSSLLLRPEDKLRYEPTPSTAATDTITIRAWDQTTGVYNTRVNTTTNGGMTAFSADPTKTSTITVTFRERRARVERGQQLHDDYRGPV